MLHVVWAFGWRRSMVLEAGQFGPPAPVMVLPATAGALGSSGREKARVRRAGQSVCGRWRSFVESSSRGELGPLSEDRDWQRLDKWLWCARFLRARARLRAAGRGRARCG